MEWWVDLSAILRNLAIVAGGGFGLWLAWSRTRALNKQTEISSEQATVDRRQKALDLYRQFCGDLEAENLYNRVAAVQGLIELASAYPDLLLDPVSRVLIAYRTGTADASLEVTSVIDPFLAEWAERAAE
ncbi:hypothetical protein [Minwuia sp.]|uniref:hypothetical protein n=1 Tax=Minwuia sp. TaxID=2493630 RepID=UPI003A8EC222